MSMKGKSIRVIVEAVVTTPPPQVPEPEPPRELEPTART
jgi:hypothetical protein